MDFAALLAEHAQSQGEKDGSKAGDRKRIRGEVEHRDEDTRGGARDKKQRREAEQFGNCTQRWSKQYGKRELDRVRGKYLVVIPAGDQSLHDDQVKGSEWQWHANSEKGFDLCVVYYGSNPEVAAKYKSHSEFFLEKKGPKWQLVRHALSNVGWKNYEYIWLPDDDLSMERSKIREMFQIASKHGILLGQPSLFDINVQPQYKSILVNRPGLVLHYTNFVEIMAPFLRVDALDFVEHTMSDSKSGWGLDQLWPTLLNFSNIAVIDATPMTHTRPQNAFNVNSSFYQTYKIDPQRECFDLMRRFSFGDYRKRSFLEIPQDRAGPSFQAPAISESKSAGPAGTAENAEHGAVPSPAAHSHADENPSASHAAAP